jgi:hypothetical protein
MKISERTEAAAKLLDRILNMLPRVDSRAQVVLSLDLGLLLTLALNVPVKNPPMAAVIFAAAAVLSVTASLWFVYRSAYPSLVGGQNSLLYFAEIAKLREADYVERFTTQEENAYLRDLTGQVWKVAEIANEKFKALKFAFRLLLLAVACWAVALGLCALHTNQLIVK